MKLTPARIKFLTFMSGTPGRVVRGGMGAALVALGLLGMGWNLLLVPLGLFMIGTGLANYCPATLLFPQFQRTGELTNKLSKYDLKG